MVTVTKTASSSIINNKFTIKKEIPKVTQQRGPLKNIKTKKPKTKLSAIDNDIIDIKDIKADENVKHSTPTKRPKQSKSKSINKTRRSRKKYELEDVIEPNGEILFGAITSPKSCPTIFNSGSYSNTKFVFDSSSKSDPLTSNHPYPIIKKSKIRSSKTNTKTKISRDKFAQRMDQCDVIKVAKDQNPTSNAQNSNTLQLKECRCDRAKKTEVDPDEIPEETPTTKKRKYKRFQLELEI